MMETKVLTMLNSKITVALSMVVLLTNISAYAQIINLNAVTDAKDSPQVFSFDAGQYDIQTIGMSDGGMYDAWSDHFGQENTWRHLYCIRSEELGEINKIGLNVQYATPEDALANAVSFSFVLTAPSDVSFYIWDGPNGYEWASDNTDGVSLLVTPEPATIALLGLGGLILRKRRA